MIHLKPWTWKTAFRNRDALAKRNYDLEKENYKLKIDLANLVQWVKVTHHLDAPMNASLRAILANRRQ